MHPINKSKKISLDNLKVFHLNFLLSRQKFAFVTRNNHDPPLKHVLQLGALITNIPVCIYVMIWFMQSHNLLYKNGKIENLRKYCFKNILKLCKLGTGDKITRDSQKN